MNWEQLCRPFQTNEVKQREGRKGMFYNYIPSDVLVKRLNEQGTDKWSYIVKEAREIMNEVVVLGSLTIMGTTKDAYGSAQMDERKLAGDCFKSASALALVKSASLFGIPCIFHAKPQQQQIIQTPAPEILSGPGYSCEDCGVHVDLKTFNYSRYNFNNHVYCRTCQPKYRNRRSG